MSAAAAHEIRIEGRWFQAIADGEKSFEVVRNDQDIQKGDQVILVETHEGNLTSRELRCRVTFVHARQGLAPGYVVLGLEREI